MGINGSTSPGTCPVAPKIRSRTAGTTGKLDSTEKYAASMPNLIRRIAPRHQLSLRRNTRMSETASSFIKRTVMNVLFVSMKSEVPKKK